MKNKYIVTSGSYFVSSMKSITADRGKARWYWKSEANKVKAEMNRRTNPNMIWRVVPVCQGM